MTAKPLFDFSKLQELDKQKQAVNEQLDFLLDQNDLIRKKMPEGSHSLLRAISDALFLTPHYTNEIKQHLFNHLTHLIDSGKLNPRLGMFRGNTVVLKDYLCNPELSGFDKINLELVSSQFKVKIVVYSISDDGYLSSIIVNNHYEKTIRIIRPKFTHYEPVYSKSYMERLGAVQNIVLNIIEKVSNEDQTVTFQNINDDSYLNFEYLNWLNSLNDNVNTSGSDRAESTPSKDPMFFANKPPPGLNPTKYPTKNFPYIEVVHSNIPVEGSSPSPGFRPDNAQITPTRPNFSNFTQLSGGSPVRQNPGLRLTVQSSQGATEPDQGTLSAKKKPIILDESKERYTGRLKFFDETKKYGFIIMDGDGSDIFVHMDDLMKANITKEMLKDPKNGVILRLGFSCMKYIGGYGKSRKATDIELLSSS